MDKNKESIVTVLYILQRIINKKQQQQQQNKLLCVMSFYLEPAFK